MHNTPTEQISLSLSGVFGVSVGACMGRFLERATDLVTTELVIWVAALSALVAVAVYVVGIIRGAPAKQERTASELISKFREMHAKGELSDAEFRTIKTQLAERLERELKDNGETG